MLLTHRYIASKSQMRSVIVVSSTAPYAWCEHPAQVHEYHAARVSSDSLRFFFFFFWGGRGRRHPKAFLEAYSLRFGDKLQGIRAKLSPKREFESKRA